MEQHRSTDMSTQTQKDPEISHVTSLSTGANSWVMFRLGEGLYALSSFWVQTMAVFSHVTEIPHTPDFIRGMVEIRGQIIPLLGLRKRLGMQSLKDEKEQLCALLNAREKDHKDWLAELENSILENREFRLATDPHKCSFGRWHDSFKTDDLSFSLLLKKFIAPHVKIHGIAHTAQKLVQAGDSEGAMHLISQTRDKELSTMIHLFDQTCAIIRKDVREIIVVLEKNGRRVAITVDKLEAVETLSPESIEEFSSLSSTEQDRLVKATGKRNSGELVLLPDIEKILAQAKEACPKTSLLKMVNTKPLFPL